jgi:hypothetical protein
LPEVVKNGEIEKSLLAVVQEALFFVEISRNRQKT